MLLDDRVLVVVERARLLEDRVGHRELADVVHEPADRERAQATRREPEQLTDLDRAQRDATRVALGVRVLVGEPHRQCADVRAEEDVLGGDEVGAAQVAGERPRLRGAREIDRDGDPDEQDAVELHLVPDPPAELRVVHRQRRDERGREPHEPDDDHEIERALREQERPQRAQREQAVGGETDARAARSQPGCSAPGPTGRGSARRAPRTPSATTTVSRTPSRTSSGRTLCRTRGSGNTDRARISAPAGRVAPPVIATTPLFPNQTPGVANPCSASRLAMTANAVPTSTVRVSRASGADHGQPERGRRRNERAEADRVEVHLPGQADLDVPPKHMDNGGCGRRRSAHDQDRQKLLSQPRSA